MNFKRVWAFGPAIILSIPILSTTAYAQFVGGVGVAPQPASSTEAAMKAEAEQERQIAAAKAEEERQAALAAQAERERQIAAAKAEQEKQAAIAAQAEKERQIAAAKAEQEKQAAIAAQAEKERQLAAARAESERQSLLAAQAEKERQIAAAKAEEERKAALSAEAEKKRAAELAARQEDKADVPKIRKDDVGDKKVWEKVAAFGPVPPKLQKIGDQVCQKSNYKHAIGFSPIGQDKNGDDFAKGAFLCDDDESPSKQPTNG